MKNQPAFPVSEGNAINSGVPGMELRDYLAARFMLFFLTEYGTTRAVIESYRAADIMLEERERTNLAD